PADHPPDRVLNDFLVISGGHVLIRDLGPQRGQRRRKVAWLSSGLSILGGALGGRFVPDHRVKMYDRERRKQRHSRQRRHRETAASDRAAIPVWIQDGYQTAFQLRGPRHRQA